MQRTRTQPLGVPGTDYHAIPDVTTDRHSPKGIDRWLVGQIVKRLDDSSIRVALWDEPDIAPREGTVVVRILDRKALFQLVTHTDLHFGDLYSSGRIEVRGNLQRLLEEAYQLGNEHSTLKGLLARSRSIAPDRSESKRNIHHHYDIGNEFYTLWLDREAHQA
jgi:cyclopropane-fatty-acyl-phospholipid synthase